jgi:hypothetical protein
LPTLQKYVRTHNVANGRYPPNFKLTHYRAFHQSPRISRGAEDGPLSLLIPIDVARRTARLKAFLRYNPRRTDNPAS